MHGKVTELLPFAEEVENSSSDCLYPITPQVLLQELIVSTFLLTILDNTTFSGIYGAGSRLIYKE